MWLLTDYAALVTVLNRCSMYSNVLSASFAPCLQKKLTVMDVGANRITSIPEDIQELTDLEDLWLNDNKVENFSETNHLLPLQNLRTLYLERNPLAKDFEYRKRLEALLPELDQIDAMPTTKARRIR